MGGSKKQSTQMSEQQGSKRGQDPRDVQQGRGSAEPGSSTPGNDAGQHQGWHDRASENTLQSSRTADSKPAEEIDNAMAEAIPELQGERRNQGQQIRDPKNPATKPQGTTKDQISTMESEGQAQQPGQDGQRGSEGPGPAKGRTHTKAGG